MVEINLTNPQIVTLVVAQLGGDQKFVDREDIAVQANVLAPGRFCWRKYPQYIDLDSVGVALRDAKKEKNGALLVGDNTKGWMLSPSGIVWVSTIDLESIGEETSKLRKNSIIASQEAEAVRLRSTNAYRLYLAKRTNELSKDDFFQFARIDSYFLKKARERRFAIIENTVTADMKLSKLWSILKELFPDEVN